MVRLYKLDKRPSTLIIIGNRVRPIDISLVSTLKY